jgi:RNA-directed DNA polymerase
MFDKIKNIKELSAFLSVKPSELQKLCKDGNYYSFEVPKTGSSEMRLIEAPKGRLMIVLDKISDSLQWMYSQMRTPAAYGYIRQTSRETDKRDILTNARRHLNHKYLLNIDLDDFFHQVTIAKVAEIFGNMQWFSFDKECEALLSNLVCYKGRLPMGSPASPPLSNFAMYQADYDLLRWAGSHQITYTRFVDDLSFSSSKIITEAYFEAINDMLYMHRFMPDKNKIKWYGKTDLKEVTGLILGKNKLELPDDYIVSVEKEIQQLASIKQYMQLFPDYKVLEWYNKLERAVTGKLSFVGIVYGKEHEVYRKLKAVFDTSRLAVPAEFSVSWRYAGYSFI